MPREAEWFVRSDAQLERSVLFDRLPKHSRGAEVGVWTGEFSAQLLAMVEPRELHLVDPWRYRTEDEFKGASYAGGMARDQSDMDQLHELVLTRFAGDQRVHVHRLDSVSAAGEFAPGSLDWVYLDGDHRYETVLADLHAWRPRIAPGGICSGDDYGETGWWGNGVTEAVDRFASELDVALTILGHQFVMQL
ncbi:MAG: hypothetical protein QOK43_2191 [Acidimicrobiaceae bacterium]|nr:hypothetical protein [Acidimicrobiaceae bacterium]